MTAGPAVLRIGVPRTRLPYVEVLRDLIEIVGAACEARGVAQVRVDDTAIDPYPLDGSRWGVHDAVVNTLEWRSPHQSGSLYESGLDAYWLCDPRTQRTVTKSFTYSAAARMGFDVPAAVAVPLTSDLGPSVAAVVERVGFPAFVKPQTGGGSRDWCTRVTDADELMPALQRAKVPMLVQREVTYQAYFRAIGLGPAVVITPWDPELGRAREYGPHESGAAKWIAALNPTTADDLVVVMRTINALFLWDFNSCEIAVDHDGRLQLIDYANHFPDLGPAAMGPYAVQSLTALALWVVCAALARRRHVARFEDRLNTYLDLAAMDGPLRGPLPQRVRHDLGAEAFREFCQELLGPARFDDQDIAGRLTGYFRSPVYADHLAADLNAIGFLFSPEQRQPRLDLVKGWVEAWLSGGAWQELVAHGRTHRDDTLTVLW
jgi:hypothetical protein